MRQLKPNLILSNPAINGFEVIKWLVLAVILAVFRPAAAGTSFGSGFFVSTTGYFLTNHHVVDGADEIRIRTSSDGKIYNARLVKFDKNTDLALLKIEGAPFPAATLLNSIGIKRGEQVFALGFPHPDIQGIEPKLTEGSISSLSGLSDDVSQFQISTPIQPGNSGGPLFTEDGRVVGVVVATMRGLQNVNYAIKSSLVLEFLSGANITVRPDLPSTPRKRTDSIAEVEKSIGLIIAVSRNQVNAAPSLGNAPSPSIVPTKFPEKQIRIIVPYAQGGPSDSQARRFAAVFGKEIGVDIVVENILGDRSITGTKTAMQAPNDGYTLLFQNMGLITASLSSESRDDWLFRGLIPLGKVLDTPLILAGSPGLGANDLQALKSGSNRGTITIVHSGEGTYSHLCALALSQNLFGNRAEVVGYRGAAPAILEIIQNRQGVLCESSPFLIQLFAANRLRPIAIVSDRRVSAIFGTQTLIEQGSDLIINNWSGLFAPKGISPDVLQKITYAVQSSLRSKELNDALIKIESLPAPPEQATPQYFSALVLKDYNRFRVGLTR